MKALRMFIWMMVLTGVVYPFIVTLIAQLTMSKQSNGSLVIRGQKPLGSALIAQRFEGSDYFWPRPSFIDYNPLPSGGSNWGPTNVLLKENMQKNIELVTKTFLPQKITSIPSELLFNSGSGLDPHISPGCAYFQAPRIAQKRGIAQEKIEALIAQHIQKRQMIFLGAPLINVLKLNIALQSMQEGNR